MILNSLLKAFIFFRFLQTLFFKKLSFLFNIMHNLRNIKKTIKIRSIRFISVWNRYEKPILFLSYRKITYRVKQACKKGDGCPSISDVSVCESPRNPSGNDANGSFRARSSVTARYHSFRPRGNQLNHGQIRIDGKPAFLSFFRCTD